MNQLALALRVNAPADALGMDSHDTRATVAPLSRARSSGRFRKRTVARWREAQGLPVRFGRQSAVTPELATEALKLLREGVPVLRMCERIGVDKRSWYRWVHQQARDEVQVRTYRRTKRHWRSPSTEQVKKMVALDKQGLPRAVIAERLGVHLNTVTKYLLQQGRRRR